MQLHWIMWTMVRVQQNVLYVITLDYVDDGQSAVGCALCDYIGVCEDNVCIYMYVGQDHTTDTLSQLSECSTAFCTLGDFLICLYNPFLTQIRTQEAGDKSSYIAIT